MSPQAVEKAKSGRRPPGTAGPLKSGGKLRPVQQCLESQSKLSSRAAINSFGQDRLSTAPREWGTKFGRARLRFSRRSSGEIGEGEISGQACPDAALPGLIHGVRYSHLDLDL